MDELISLLEFNNVKYEHGDYAGHKSIIIKKNKYQLEIFRDKKGYVSDLQRIPYLWGKMGSTTLEEILEDLKDFLGIKIKYSQTNIFDFIE